MKITRKTRRPITREIKKFAREDGWSEEDIARGYSYFNTQLGVCRPYTGKSDGWEIHSALHVEVIGIMGVFNSDEEAALYGEKFFGEKIFHYSLGKDEEISLYWFVDEPTTRETIERYLAEKYGENHGFLPDHETVPKQKSRGSFIVRHTFYESPNFSMLDPGETVDVQSFERFEDAESLLREHVLEILRYYNADAGIASVEDSEGRDFYATFGGSDFCTIHYKDVVTNIFNIIDMQTDSLAHRDFNNNLEGEDNELEEEVCDNGCTKILVVVKDGLVQEVHCSDVNNPT